MDGFAVCEWLLCVCVVCACLTVCGICGWFYWMLCVGTLEWMALMCFGIFVLKNQCFGGEAGTCSGADGSYSRFCPCDCFGGYGNTRTSSVCTSCSSGKYLVADSGCADCATQTVAFASYCTGISCSSTGDCCDESAPGVGLSLDRTQCNVECPAGSSKSGAGKGMCTLCAAGMFSAAGSATCTPCPAGHFNTPDRSACIAIEDGRPENVTATPVGLRQARVSCDTSTSWLNTMPSTPGSRFRTICTHDSRPVELSRARTVRLT